MKYVDAVVTSSNIFINIQADKALVSTHWDLSNKKLFQPFLSDRSRDKFFPKGIESVQTELIYEEPNHQDISRLEKEIMEFVSEKIEVHHASSQAGGHSIKWNYGFSKKIKNQLLAVFENFKYKMRPTGIDGAASKSKVDEAVEQMTIIQNVVF